MSSDAWDTVAPPVSRSLGASRCVAAYSEALLASNGALSSAIDDYARSNGPTDELLSQVASAAKGELVLVMTIAGKLPVKQSNGLQGDGSPAPSIGGGSRGAGMGGPGPGGRMRRPMAGASDTNELDISASLYSVAQRRIRRALRDAVLGRQRRRRHRPVRRSAGPVAARSPVRRLGLGRKGRRGTHPAERRSLSRRLAPPRERPPPAPSQHLLTFWPRAPAKCFRDEKTEAPSGLPRGYLSDPGHRPARAARR